MKSNYLNIAGLMTGTSMDGIDISIAKTNGSKLVNLKNFYYEFNLSSKKELLNILKNKLSIISNQKLKKKADQFVTNLHYKALQKLNSDNKYELIGFHGQTILHDPKNQLSFQLGDPYLLSNLMKKDVIFDFRSNDLKNGGQGAPLAPIYHKYIIKKYNLNLPSCILNIGGICNLTYWDGERLIGFDVGPGNTLLDDFIRNRTNFLFDKNGFHASKGSINKDLIELFFQNSYFSKPYPKSLDKESFESFFSIFLKKQLSLEDGLATLTNITIKCILKSIEDLPKKIESIVVCGGGYNNTFLIQQLEKHLNLKISNSSLSSLNNDFVESEMIAYIASRSFYKLPITFPETTGVEKPLSGGKFIDYKKPFTSLI